MTLICPHCQTRLKANKPSPDGVYTCLSCQGKFDLPVEGRPLPPDPPPKTSINPYPAPIVVPIPVNMMNGGNPFEFDEEEMREEKQERKERRDERRDERKLRGLDRKTNPLGVASLALSVTTLVFMCSGLAFRRDLPLYTGAAGCLGVPGSLSGLICGIIGLCKPGRPKLLAGIGTGIGAMILLLMVPLTFLDLTQPKK